MNAEQPQITITKYVWNQIPKEVCWGSATGYVAFLAGWSSAFTFACLALAYEVAKWWIERDMERMRQGLEREYGIALDPKPGRRRFRSGEHG